MIVVYGYADDAPIRMALEALVETGADHLVVDPRRLDRHDLVVGAGIDGWLRVDGREVALAEVTAVYARPLVPRPSDPSAAARARAEAFGEAFVTWLDSASALVVNRPRAMESNASKPYQAQLIARAGFAVPETLVTNDPDEVLDFRRAHGRIVFKSLSGIRSIVRELGDADLPRLPLLATLPVQFQRYLPGRDVRVHVVGEETFAAAIDSTATDYRYAAREGARTELEPFPLPDEIARRCVDLTARLGLVLSGVDLRLDADGGWACFEVNPMPAYSYFESHTGLPIAAALSRLLARADDRTVRTAVGKG